MLVVKQALFIKAALQGFELRLQRTLALELHRFDHQLVLTPGLVYAQLAMDLHLHPVRQPGARTHRRPTKKNAGDLSSRVFQREILMPRGLQAVIADLALNPDIADLAF